MTEINANLENHAVLPFGGGKLIGTAPKDGTKVLIWDQGVYVASWSNEAHDYQFAEYPGWQIYDCEDGFYSVASKSPTHWMPLPEPPK